MFKKLGSFLKSKFTNSKILSFLNWIWKDIEAGNLKNAEKKIEDEVRETINETKKI